MSLGVVEDINDPLKLGRVKVRIPSKHGVGDSAVDTSVLDWSEPAPPFYSGYKFGSYAVPRVGSIVWIINGGDDVGSIYLGSCHGSGSDGGKLFNGAVVPSDESEVPDIITDDNYTSSTIIYQSPGGSCHVAVLGDEVVELKSGSSKIVLADGNIKIETSGSNIELDGGDIYIKASGNVYVDKG